MLYTRSWANFLMEGLHHFGYELSKSCIFLKSKDFSLKSSASVYLQNILEVPVGCT